MKKAKLVIFVIVMMFVISACSGRPASSDSSLTQGGNEKISEENDEPDLTVDRENSTDRISEQEEQKAIQQEEQKEGRQAESKAEQQEEQKAEQAVEQTEEENVMDELILSIGDRNIAVEWEDNESVDALNDFAGSGIEINMSMYGGFEQVGGLGTSLPSNDSQTTTGPGDIVLYSGNQIVIFYGSNSWSYTRLGKITGLNEKELEDTFGNGDVTIKLTAGTRTTSSTDTSFNFDSRSVMLNSGYEMPIMGLGTYSLDYDTCVNSVKALLKNGGRLIDTAYMYGNEDAVGEGIRQAMEEYGIPREEIFVITKIYPSQFDDSEAAIDMALEKLDIGYIDMMLLHHPGTGDVEAYKTMERYVKEGKIRSLGLSNWYVEELTEFLPQISITPALVQNEIHPYYQEQDVVPFIQEKGIVVQCWYPLGGRGHTADLLGDETIKSIAKAHGVSSAQVILRWDLQRGIVVIPGSGNPDHIKENLDLFGFELTEDEMEQISQLDRGEKHDWY